MSFLIEDGVLKMYVGENTPTVKVPEGVRAIGKTAFKDDVRNITHIELPESVRVIQDDAFFNLSYLERVSMPPQLDSIGESSFRLCWSLEEIVIPHGIRILEKRAFSGCAKMKKAELPDTLTVIELCAFMDCTELSDVKLPPSLKLIRKNAFYGCESLKDITLPDSVTEIGGYAFSGCGIERISIPAGVKCLPIGVFKSCDDLREVEISEGLTEIGEDAFAFCPELERISLPESLERIGCNAFKMCSKLKELYIPAGVELGRCCFESNVDAVIAFDGKTHIIRYDDKFSKDTFRYAAAKGFAQAFLNGDEMDKEAYLANKKYIIQQKDTYLLRDEPSELIVRYLLKEGLISLEELSDLIERFSESGNSQITAILLEHKNERFSHEDEIRLMEEQLSRDPMCEEEIKKSWKFVCDDDGTACLVSYIGTDKDVTVPVRVGEHPVVYIGYNALCADPYSNIEKVLCRRREQIRSVFIPEGVRDICASAFKGCHSLKEIVLPQSVRCIADSAFCNCSQLRRAVLPDSLEEMYPKCFFNCSSLEEVILPSDLDVVPTHSFMLCRSLRKIEIPRSVTHIGDYAFANTALEEVHLPDGVMSIGLAAFSDCKQLKRIYIPASVTKLGIDVFGECSDDLTICAPSGSDAIDHAKQHGIKYIEL